MSPSISLNSQVAISHGYFQYISEKLRLGLLVLAMLLVGLPAALASNPLQMEVELKNAYRDGSNYYFDLFLKQVGPAPILLAFSDFSFSINPANANMQLSMVPGSSNLRSAAGFGLSYESNIRALILPKNGSIIGMINADAPLDLNPQNHAYKVALIDQAADVHRLGRFLLSNYAGALNDFDLDLRINASGSNSKVFGLDVLNNFNAIPVELFYKKPAAFDQQLVRSIDVKFSGDGLAIGFESAFESSLFGYKLLKSFDLLAWHIVDEASAHNNQAPQQQYQLVDRDPAGGRSLRGEAAVYYRVVALQQNGQVFESPAKRVMLNQKISFNIYPNPAGSEVNVRLANYHSFDAFHLRIYDSAGRMVYNQVIDGAAQPIVDVNHLADGAYFVQVQSGRSQSVNRLIVLKGR